MTDTESQTDAPGTPPRPTDARMVWMMIGCCLAIPLALILGGASLAGASPWLIGLAVVLAIALVFTRRQNVRRMASTPRSQRWSPRRWLARTSSSPASRWPP